MPTYSPQYMYDGLRCFIPIKKHSVRTIIVVSVRPFDNPGIIFKYTDQRDILQGLHFVSVIFFLLWMGGMAVIKYKLGFVYTDGIYIPYPFPLWPVEYNSWTTNLLVFLVVAFCAFGKPLSRVVQAVRTEGLIRHVIQKMP